jgi:hypothetical protein
MPDDGSPVVPIVLHDKALPELGEGVRGIMSQNPQHLEIRATIEVLREAEGVFRDINAMEPARRALMHAQIQRRNLVEDCGWTWTADYRLRKAAPGLSLDG